MACHHLNLTGINNGANYRDWQHPGQPNSPIQHQKKQLIWAQKRSDAGLQDQAPKARNQRGTGPAQAGIKKAPNGRFLIMVPTNANGIWTLEQSDGGPKGRASKMRVNVGRSPARETKKPVKRRAS